MGLHHSRFRLQQQQQQPSNQSATATGPPLIVLQKAPATTVGVFGFTSLLLKTAPSLYSFLTSADVIVEHVARTNEATLLVHNYLASLKLDDLDWKLWRFEPHVLRERTAVLTQMPSMTHLERLLFISGSMRVRVVDSLHDDDSNNNDDNNDNNNNNNNNSTACWISVASLCEYHRLAAQLVELLALLLYVERNGGRQPDICDICFDRVADSLLPCGHQLCEHCEKAWVKQRLDCPFCRHSYASFTEIAQHGWALPSDLPAHVVQQDIATLCVTIRNLVQMDSENVSNAGARMQDYEPISYVNNRLGEEGEDRDDFGSFVN